MAKLVVTKSADAKNGKGVRGAVTEKRVRSGDGGGFVTVRTIVGESMTFGRDLTYVFSKNVAKARRENKAVAGVTDLAPAKG